MGHKNKLLLIITDYGSFNNFLSELSISIVNNIGLELHVICSPIKIINYEDKFNFKINNIHFHFIDIPRELNIFKQIYISIQIQKKIKYIQPDLIHAHFTTGIFTTILLKFNTIPIWGTFHGLGYVVSRGFKKILFQFVEYLSFYKLNRIILINNTDYSSIPSFFKNKSFLQNSKGLGCDLSKFNPLSFNNIIITSIKNDLSCQNSFVIGYTGRFVNFKGFDLVIRTFFYLKSKTKYPIKLLLIGGIDSKHKTGLNDIEIDLFKNDSDIINIGFTSNVSKYLSIMDLFFFPSRKEGVPVSITEALAMGIPVLTLNTRGCNELVTHNFNGYVVDSNLSNELLISIFSDHIINLFHNVRILQNFKNNAISQRNILDRNNFITENSKYYTEFLKQSSTLKGIEI